MSMNWDAFGQAFGEGMIDVGKYVVKDSFEQRAYERKAAIEQKMWEERNKTTHGQAMEIQGEKMEHDLDLAETKREHELGMADTQYDRDNKLQGSKNASAERIAQLRADTDKYVADTNNAAKGTKLSAKEEKILDATSAELKHLSEMMTKAVETNPDMLPELEQKFAVATAKHNALLKDIGVTVGDRWKKNMNTEAVQGVIEGHDKYFNYPLDAVPGGVIDPNKAEQMRIEGGGSTKPIPKKGEPAKLPKGKKPAKNSADAHFEANFSHIEPRTGELTLGNIASGVFNSDNKYTPEQVEALKNRFDKYSPEVQLRARQILIAAGEWDVEKNRPKN